MQLKADIKRLGPKRWRARVADDKTVWHFEWDQQRKQWMLVRAEGERNRDPELKPLIMDAINRVWGHAISELVLDE